MREKDADGRLPITQSEYIALRRLYGGISCLSAAEPDIKERLQSFKFGWCRWKLMLWCADWLLTSVLRTIPKKKLSVLHSELPAMKCTVFMEVAAVNLPTDHCVVPMVEMNEATKKLMELECCMCQKRGKAAKRCETRRMLEKLVPWDFAESVPDEVKKLDCPLKWGNEFEFEEFEEDAL